MIGDKSVHLRLSSAGDAALTEFALRRGLTKANAAALLLDEAIYGRDRAPLARPPERQPDVNAGFVYVVRAGEFCKIGKAKNARNRVARLRLPFEHEIVLTAAVGNRHEAERRLHQRFAAQRANGEWFRLTDDDISGISRDLEGSAGIRGENK